jgi:autotransporter-associated beta strand protein
MKTPRALRFVTLLTAAFAGLAAQAETTTFKGSPGSLWSNAAHWSGPAPVAGSTRDLVFNNNYNQGAPVESRNDLKGLVANSIIFVPQGADNVLSGEGVTLAEMITVSTGNWQTIAFPIELRNGQHVVDVRSGRLTLSGTVSGSGGLAKTGGATLLLESQNTYTGGTVVDRGVLRLAKGGSVGAIRGMVTVNAEGSLASQARDSFGYEAGLKVDILNILGGTVTHESPENLTLSSLTLNMQGGTLKSSAAGSIDLYNARFVGGPDVRAAVNTLPCLKSAVIAGKLALRQGDEDPVGTVFNVADGAAEVDLRIAAVIADGGHQGAASAIQKSGPGLMELAAVNTYTGPTFVNEGTLFLRVNSAIAESSLFVLAGGSLASGPYSNRIAALQLKADSTLLLANGGELAFTDSSLRSWKGTLSILGPFQDGQSIRFGSSQEGITMAQLAKISINGKPASIDSMGYLSILPNP